MPTCVAASPTPTSWYIVSIMSSSICAISGVTTSTGFAGCLSVGSPYSRTVRSAIALSPLSGALLYQRDVRRPGVPLCEDRRLSGELDGIDVHRKAHRPQAPSAAKRREEVSHRPRQLRAAEEDDLDAPARQRRRPEHGQAAHPARLSQLAGEPGRPGA